MALGSHVETRQWTVGEIRLERSLPVPMRDGVVLRADVYRPPDDGPWPVVLKRTPWGRRERLLADPRWTAAHGYIVALQDCRGCGESDGSFYPYLHEGRDGYDTVAWAADLPGSSGAVGMYGPSYAGAVQLLAAMESPPALRAIAPAISPSQFHDGWMTEGGAVRLAFVLFWTLVVAMAAAERAGDAEEAERLGELLGALPRAYGVGTEGLAELVGPYGGFAADMLAHPDDDGYWQRWAIERHHDRIGVPALHVGGLYDAFLEGTVRNFAGLQARAATAEARALQRLVIGDFDHLSFAPIRPGAPRDAGPLGIDELTLAWFDLTLKGEDRGAFESPVSVYVPGDGWRHAETWPPPAAEEELWHLDSGGRANSVYGDGVLVPGGPPGQAEADVLTVEASAPPPSIGGHSCCEYPGAPMGPADQRELEVRRDVLVFTSPPLSEPATYLGPCTLALHREALEGHCDLTARLCLVSSDGASVNVQEGIRRARPQEGVEHVVVELGTVGVHVPAGSRLRLLVSGADFPQWDVADRADVSVQLIHHGGDRPSFLRLRRLPDSD